VNLQRITRIQVAVVWLVVVVAIALLFVIMFIGPQRKKIQGAEQQRDAAQEVAVQRPAAEKAFKQAQAAEIEVTEKYQKIMDERMPKLDFNDPIASTIRMLDYGDEEQSLMDRWFASTGARVSGYGFPQFGASMPGSFQNPDREQLDPLNWNLTVEVKDFPELLDWLLKLPKAPRLMVLQTVTIQGPREAGQPLVAQVPVTLYEWTGVLPQASAAAVAGAEGAAAGPQVGGGGMGGRGRGGGGRGGGGRGGGGRGGMRGGRGRRGGM
jgi:uncharacterized membrane protein YgcG